MSGDTRRLLARWIDTALREGRRSGKTNKGLAAALKLDSTQVTRMRNGERAIKAHELRVIEGYLGEKAPGFGGREASAQQVTAIGGVTLIPVEAIIAPAVWREVGVPVNSAEKAFALPDPELAGLKQYACKVDSDQGRLVICVPYRDVRVHPHDGDLVHVVRTKADLEEHTLWVIKSGSGGFSLEPEKGSGPQIKFPHSADKGIEIRGLVIADQYRRKF